MNNRYEIIHSPLYRLRNRRKLAALLKLPEDYFRKEHAYQYTEFSSPKQNGEGTRYYCVPPFYLKITQKRICKLMSRIITPDWVMSGKKNTSYIKNAAEHIQSRYVKTMDISAFYDSTQKKHVYRMFTDTFLMEKDIAGIMTDLVMYNDKLPTGSPSSQVIVYWTFKDMFQSIYEIAVKYGCTFTLYVDDMTFSSDHPIRSELRREVEHILNKYGLHAKFKKDHYYQPNNLKVITGVGIKNGNMVVLNKKRKSILEQYEICKKTDNIKEIERLQGMLSSLRQIEPSIFQEIYNYIKHNQDRLIEHRRKGNG